jgi:hypothetical protein
VPDKHEIGGSGGNSVLVELQEKLDRAFPEGEGS